MLPLFKYTKGYRPQIFLAPLFKLLEAIFELLLPLQMAKLIDQGIKHRDSALIMHYAGVMVAMAAAGILSALVCQYFASVSSQGLGTRLRNELMRKINALDAETLSRFGTDTLITRLTNDITQVQTALAMFMRLFMRAPFLSIGSIIMAFYIQWQMGLIFLATFPLFLFILVFIIQKTVPLYEKVQQMLDQLNRQIAQTLSGVRVIRAFRREGFFTKNNLATSDRLASASTHVANISALLSPLTTLVMNGAILFLLYFGAIRIDLGTLQQGQILALINYMNQMLLALIVVTNLAILFTRAEASGKRIQDVFDAEPVLTPGKIALTDLSGPDLLVFQDVSFRYPEARGDALSDIAFTLPRGKWLGITGATGSGKSTLLQLIPRFFDPSRGTILLAGDPLASLLIKDVRRVIGIVPQHAVLMTGTIRANLQWGKAAATDEECWEALEIAQIADFVRRLPQQLDSRLEEGGQNLSGGQKQRLAIARAVIKKPPFLLLDDALSALDYETDLALRQSLKKSLADTTVCLTSQRISSLKDAEQILVLADGRAAGLGTDRELLASCKEYQELSASQESELAL